MNYLLRRKSLGKTSITKIAELSRTGLRAFRNDDYPLDKEADYVFRWGCTSNVKAKTIINKAKAIHAVADKAGFRLALQEQQPWWPCWTEFNDVKFPAVVRPAHHAQGRHLYVVNNKDELRGIVPKLPGWYAAPLIDKVAEYRVFVVSGRCVCVASKAAVPNQVAWNVAQGGKFTNVRWDDWPLKAVKRSIAAIKLSGLDFGGVDIMVDREGQTYILELNSAPSLTSPYRQGCFAKAFDYIVQNGNDIIPLQEAPGGYKKFIHPAVLENANG